MSDLYPLLMVPFFSPRPWGVRDLRPIYSEFPGEEPIGEAWLTGDDCKIANGPFAGKTLDQLAKQYGREFVGKTAPDANRYPLLMKFLFPRERLSVQVHPDDGYAHKIGQPCGKTECWYVLAANPGAQIGLGLKPGTTQDELERAIREVRAENLLNWIDVHPGEMYYVDAGTVHAIGGGSILVETQQNSDTTFRLYDYGRPRELHIEHGLAAMRERTRAGKVIGAEPPTLIASPFFVVNLDKLPAGREMKVSGNDSAISLVPTRGAGVIHAEGCAPVTFNVGQAIVIPASVRTFNVAPQWDLEMITARVPGEAVELPETQL
jgi:mannose-6-phosphate isomerase